MAATAPRTTKPATTPPARRSTRASSALSATRHTTVPPLTVVKGPQGTAIQLGNTAAARDPRFNGVIEKLEKSSAKAKEHVRPVRKAAEAQAAAQPPENEKLAGVKANQVDTMKGAGAETKKPDPDSFLTLLEREIEKVMPKKLGDTENFMEGDKIKQLKGAMTGNIHQREEEASGPMKSASSPNQLQEPSTVEGKEVTPLPSEGPPAPPPAVGAADVLPAPKADSEVSLQQSKKDADKLLQDAQVTPEQLQKANDPRFSAVLTAKSAIEKQADSAPQKYRTGEQKTLTQEAAKAVADEKQGLTALRGERVKTGAAVKLHQLSTEKNDKTARQQVTDTIEKIYNDTRDSVECKLKKLETDVSTLFDEGIKAAITKMTKHVNHRLAVYKSKRYGGLLGGYYWFKDRFFDLPDDVKKFYKEGQKIFKEEMHILAISISKKSIHA